MSTPYVSVINGQARTHNNLTQAWKPLPPPGDGWILVAGLQGEDTGDLVAHWVRPSRRPAPQ